MSDLLGWQTPVVSLGRGPCSYEDASAIETCVEEALEALSLPPDFFRPGDRVVLKPNWVKEHDERYPGPDHWQHVVTHPALIEAVASHAAARIQPGGQIIICDAPQTDSSFDRLRAYGKLDEMMSRLQSRFPGVKFELLDLRPEEWNAVDGVTVSKRQLPGDPAGSVHVHLDDASEFVAFHGLGRLYGASYDMAETNRRHAQEKHEYMLCRTPVESDVLINLPKLKTHKKVGVTCSLKNLVGINAEKNWLPHHTEGTPSEGGDQFMGDHWKSKAEGRLMGRIKALLKGRSFLSRLFVPLKKIGRKIFGDTAKVVRSGNWYGNDTCWRMVLDLNKCLFYYDGLGRERLEPIRYLSVVDGIIGGEGDGPMTPDAKPCGVILAGTSPVAVDLLAATIMGFDVTKLKLLAGVFGIQKKPLANFKPADVMVRDADHGQIPLAQFPDSRCFRFRPHFGWMGHIEKARNEP